MEPPVSFDADVVRDEQAKILRAIAPIEDRDVLNRAVRGQYGPNQQGVVGYRQELNVAPASRTETFIALKILIDNWRGAGGPFYIRPGKPLPQPPTPIGVPVHAPP